MQSYRQGSSWLRWDGSTGSLMNSLGLHLPLAGSSVLQNPAGLQNTLSSLMPVRYAVDGNENFLQKQYNNRRLKEENDY